MAETAKKKLYISHRTPRVIAKYAYVDKVDAKSKKHKITLLFDKTRDAVEIGTLKDLAAQIRATLPANFKGVADPLKDGDKEKDTKIGGPKFPGYMFLTAKAAADKRPLKHNKTGKIDPEVKIFGGDTVRADICYAAYDFDGDQGVTVYLNAVQQIKEGPRDATKPFDDESGDDEGYLAPVDPVTGTKKF